MPFINSIASRIFGLAVVLVCLMIVLAAFLLWQVAALNGQLQCIAGYYVPLDDCFGDLNESGLRRRLAFERWQGALSSRMDRTAAVTDAEANYEKFSAKLDEQVRRAQALLSAPPHTAESVLELQHLRTSLAQMVANYGIITKRQHEVISLLQQGDSGRAADILHILDDVQDLVQKQRSELEDVTSAIIADSTHAASHRHLKIVWTTILATLTSVLLGLTVAALVTRRLVQPVRSLMTGMHTVEQGDLTIELPIQSADEIGSLTRSFNFFVQQLRQKEELRNTFGKYVDPRILDRVLAAPSTPGASGGRQEMSVSFADLVGFTGIGEQLTPAAVVNLLNRHFTLQAEAIQQYHGVVDKFMGDAVMAFWGVPFTAPNEHALLACRAALGQAQAIARLQTLLPEITGLRKNLPRLDVRIGISAGEVIVGNIGSENTRSYTVIGDTVNLASRLEHANRFYGTRILLCETTCTGAGPAILTREIDTIVVKGKTETTRIFELLGLADDPDDTMVALCIRSATALAAYRAQDWDTAERNFRDCLTIAPEDRPAHLFLERIKAFRLQPPGSGWNGSWIFDEK